MAKLFRGKPMTEKLDKIDTWIEERFGTPNTFNRQLLDNFIEFLEKELGYVIKDPDQSLPDKPKDWRKENMDYCAGYYRGERRLLLEHWVKVKEE